MFRPLSLPPRFQKLTSVLTFALLVVAFAARDARADDEGWIKPFDGKSLDGWDGNPKFWRAEDGMITGETSKDNPTKGNTFLIWRGGTTDDFELKAEYKIIGHNSGIQYRSFEVPGEKWVVGGYQADFEAGDKFSGILYGERFRGILCDRGQKTTIGKDHKPTVTGTVGNSQEIQSKIKKEDWNEYHITANGFHFEHRINGVLTAVCDDEDTGDRRSSGILALQLHAGPPMKVQFRNIRLRRIVKGQAASTGAPKKIVLIAGKASHGFSAHEHKAGCVLLAEALNQNVPEAWAQVVTEGWPKDASILNDAASIVVYADGGEGHPLMKHLDEFDAQMKKGVGVVCIHYAVEVPAGKSGERMAEWTGGYFEPNWSVNPHWTARYQSLPRHEVTQGVKPFSINDEWYYHMRFLGEGQGLTPILTDLPSDETLSRPDGTHSGNKDVREAIARKEPQHMAWARERPDGGRGFGITGGHVHWNWANDNFRKLVLNAIVWSAHLPVPSEGVPSHSLTVKQLEVNQDEPIPKDYNPARVKSLLKEWLTESKR